MNRKAIITLSLGALLCYTPTWGHISALESRYGRNVKTQENQTPSRANKNTIAAQKAQKGKKNTQSPAKKENALHKAVKEGMLTAEHPLLNDATIINEADRNGMTPLMQAAMYNRAEATAILVRQPGIAVDKGTPQYGTTALMMAAMNGYTDVTAALLGYCNVNQRNESGMTALMMAARGGYANIVEQLLQAGANRDHSDNSYKTALDYAATEEVANLLTAPQGTQAHSTLPGMIEAVAQLYQRQGNPANFVALPFSMKADDNGCGYAYHFLGQSGDSRLTYANDNYLVTMERIFGSFDRNAVALHFWDARTFAYKSSILHNGMLGQLTTCVSDDAHQRFAIAFSSYASAYTTQGSLAYNYHTGHLEYTPHFNEQQFIECRDEGYKAPFRSPAFENLPAFKNHADNIFLKNTRQCQQIPQLNGLSWHFTAKDEDTIRSIDFDTLQTSLSLPEQDTTDEIKAEDIPGLPAGMKMVAINELQADSTPHYRLCVPDTETRALHVLAMAAENTNEKIPSLFIYDIPRQQFYPLPKSALEFASVFSTIFPSFGDSDCGKVLHNTMMWKRWTEWSGPELLNPQTGSYEKIIFNGQKADESDIVAYNISAPIPASAQASIGSQLSVWNSIPGDNQHTYWLAACDGYCALFLMDETNKTGKLVQSWQGAWGQSRWTPQRPTPVWLSKKRWLCLPMKDHCWEVYNLADPTQPAAKTFTIYTGAGASWVIVLPDGRYAGTPGCETLLYATDSENGNHGVQAWAPWRNRPAEVLEAIGGNANDITALRETTKRWLARKGMDAHNMPQEPSLHDFPRVEAETTPLRPESDTLLFNVTLTASHKKALTTLEVRADGAIIPQEWSNSLLVLPGQKQTVQVSIPLRAGQNHIELTPIDSMSLAGEPVRFRAVRPASSASRLFVVALGVSDYDNDDLDLQYAAKDAKDIAAVFAEQGAGEVKSLTLTDHDVADAGVLEKIRVFLSESNAQDRIVLYLAGHGMLDEHLDYHYAPASFDVEKIQQTGIALTSLTELMQSALARERLLLLDTCHSGQLGEAGEEKLAASGVQLPHGVRAIQTRGMKVKNATGTFTNSNQQKRYIEEMFTLGEENRGINIIAGAAGAEYALESGEWSNGVFTAATIQTLQQPIDSDENNDGALSVTEVFRTLQRKVENMTGGAQKPHLVAIENPNMILVSDPCYAAMFGHWDAICQRIKKAKSAQEVLFILDIINYYQAGNKAYDDSWEKTEYSKGTHLRLLKRNYNDAQQEHLKKAFLLGQRSYVSQPEDVPFCVWQAALEQNVAPEDIFHICDYSPQLLRLLLEKGLSPDMKTVFGVPILMEDWTAENRVQILLEAGANPNAQDAKGNTLLHRLIRQSSGTQNSNIVELLHHLFRHGADLSIRNNKGEAALTNDTPYFRTIKAIERLMSYIKENQQHLSLSQGLAPITLGEKIVTLDYSQAEESYFNTEKNTGGAFKTMDAHTQASQKKVIQAYYSPEGKSGYIRAYAKTGPNTATLQVLEFNDNGAQLAALLAKYADQLTPQQISHLLSIVLADGHCTEMSLTFTSPTTATATTLSLSDGETEQTIRHINITLVDTLPAEENMEQTSADESH